MKPVEGRRHWKTKDITGQRFGNLVVLHAMPPDGCGRVKWKLKCDCGGETIRMTSEITKSAKKRALTCAHKCPLRAVAKKHDMSAHPAYWVWRSMRDRCQLPTHQAWKNYGGRGITVCERWDSFEAFWEDMGPTYKKGLTLDRLDNSKGYSPENCGWRTRKQQASNTRKNRFIETPWGKMTVKQASEKSGVGVTTLLYRLNHGVPAELMFSVPDVTNRFTT